MVSFLIVAAVMIVAVITTLSYRLWRAPPTIVADESVDAIGVLRDQRRELDSEVAADRMTADERDARVDELTRRVYEEGLLAPTRAPIAHPRRRVWLAASVALMVPLIAIPIYLLIGNPTALDPANRVASAGTGGADMSAEQIRTILDQLKAKLEKTPDDLKGWTMLGRGLRLVNDFAGSAAAFEKANALSPGDASLLAAEADSLAMAQGKNLEGRPRELIQQALVADPKSPKALALAASAEFAQGKLVEARGYWQRLLAAVPPESESANEVREILSQLDARIAARGGAPSGRPSTAALPPSSGLPKSASSSAASSAPGPPVRKSASVAAISGTVRLSPSVAGRVAPGDVLFIFARAVDGPRMPLAIIRSTAADLPRSFKLDDSLAMAGGPALSSVAQVRIEARVSKTGDASPKPGDIRGESIIVTPGMSNVDVVIDKVVP